MKNKIQYIFVLSILLVMLVLAKESLAQQHSAGIIDFRLQLIDSVKPNTLNGKWKFFPHKLLTPEQIAQNNHEYMVVDVPNTLTKYTFDNKPLPSNLYGTYHATILLDSAYTNTGFGFIIKNLISSYKLFANGRLITQKGIVSTTSDSYSGESGNDLAFTRAIKNKKGWAEIDLVFQVANFEHGEVGIVKPIEFSTAQNIGTFYWKEQLSDMFVLGIILTIMFSQLMLYFIYPKNKNYLYFSLLLLIVFVRSATVSKLAYFFIPYFEYKWALTLEYTTAYLIIAALATLMKDVYKSDKNLVINIIIGWSLATTLFIIFSPIRIFVQLNLINNILLGLSGLYLTFIYVMPKALKKRGAALYPFVGILFVYLAGINDVLSAMNIINSTYLIQFGLIAYIALQTFQVNTDFANSVRQNIQLTETLQNHNKQLEQTVKTRTEEIRTQNEALLEQKEELQATNAKMREFQMEVVQQSEEMASNFEELQLTKRELEIKSEMIMGSIRYAQHIQQAMLPKNEVIDQFVQSFLIYLPKDVVSGDFYWFSHFAENDHRAETFFFVVSDCTGHGVPGAFMSMLGIRFLGEIINERKIHETDLALTLIDKNVQAQLRQKDGENNDGMDMVICKLVKLTQGKYELFFTGAKRPLHIRRMNGTKVERVKGDRKSIGGHVFREREEPFTQHRFELQSGDMIYLSSDGYADQNSFDRKRLGSKKFQELIETNYDKPLNVQKKILFDVLKSHQGKDEQRDDITVWGIRVPD